VTIAGQVPTVSFTTATQTVTEVLGTAVIAVQLSSPSTQAVTVPYTVGGTATNPADYTIAASPLVIPAGSLAGTITATVVNDGVAEPDETVIVTLGTPTNATLGATTVHTLTIAGQVPTVSFAVASQTVSELVGPAVIVVQLSSPSTQAVTVPYTVGGTATNPADYTIAASPLVIPAGSLAGTITATVVNDGVAEPDETVIVTLGTPTNASLGATTVHTLTIAGQVPTVSFATASQTVTEVLGTAVIAVQLSIPSSQTVTVPYTVGGTATNPADYTIAASPLVIPAGSLAGTITLAIVDDGVAEPNETVVVTLGTPTNATLGATTVHTLTIAGQVPTVTFATASQTVSELVGTALIVVQLSGPSTQAVTVPYTMGGTATNPADYTITASPLVIPAGSLTGTITVTVVNDGVAEPNETVVVTMGTPTNATLGATPVHTLTILAQLPTVSFTAASQTVNENVGTVTITAQISGPSTQDVTVPYTVAGTATNPADYTVIDPSPIVIPAGKTTATVRISVVNDTLAEPDETVIMSMGVPTNATLGTTPVHTVIIASQLPIVSFTAALNSVSENVGTATITIQLSRPATQTVSIPYTVSGTATSPADYALGDPSPLVISAGFSIASLPVRVVDDAIPEPDETVIVALGLPTNAVLGVPNVHTLTITNNDPHPPVLSGIDQAQVGAINTCDIFAPNPPGTRFFVSYNYSDPLGDVRAGATTFVSYRFSNGGVGSFDGTPTTTIGGDGFTGRNQTDTCFRFGPASSVDVTITVTDLAGFVSQPITVTIPRPIGANSVGIAQPLGVGSMPVPVGIGPR
jgi:hypothetical protein